MSTSLDPRERSRDGALSRTVLPDIFRLSHVISLTFAVLVTQFVYSSIDGATLAGAREVARTDVDAAPAGHTTAVPGT
jgi:hypothetical protein